MDEYDEFAGLDEAIAQQGDYSPIDVSNVEMPMADNSDVTLTEDPAADLSGVSNGIDMSQYGATEIQNNALPGQPGYGWKYYSDGTVISPEGKYYTNDPETGKTTMVYDPSSGSGSFVNSLLQNAKSAFTKKDAQGNESIDWAALGAAGAALYSKFGGSKSTGASGGYNKTVPKMDAIRQQVQYNDQGRRPGEGGRQYFTNTQFVPQGDAAAKTAALDAAQNQAQGLASLQAQRQPQENPWAGKMNLGALKPAARQQPLAPASTAAMPTIPQAQPLEQKMAAGGITSLARGGRYLAGSTDGMADKIPTSIDGKDPAALSHGEFVIPADVVSHLGNGNSEAGAKKLYDMMSKVRKARTGNPKQGKQINPDKFMPGGIVGLAVGGEVKRFNGETTSTVQASGGIPLDTSKTSTLSPWVGDYVTNALGQTAAMAAAPYQAYQGPLTAGPSNLQQQAFAGSSEIAQTGYTPTQFSAGTFDTSSATRYMNPYLEAALKPQLEEARRQAEITRASDAGRLTKAGAYGGGRQAIMESELNRNLMAKQNELLGTGYATAYDKAMAQFNADQARQMEVQKADEASRQYGADYGLKSLSQLATMGQTQRDIEQAGIEADKKQFEEQRDWAYKMPQYQLNALQGLPISAQQNTTDPDTLAKLQSDIAGLASLYKTLSNLGVTKP